MLRDTTQLDQGDISEFDCEFDTDFGASFRSTGLADEEPCVELIADGLADACDDLRNQLDAAEQQIKERLTIEEAVAFLETNAPGCTFGMSCYAMAYAGFAGLNLGKPECRYEVRWHVLGGSEKHCHVFSGKSWREAIDKCLSAVFAVDNAKAA